MDLELCDQEQTARCKKLAVHVLQEMILDLAGHARTDRYVGKDGRAEKEVAKFQKEAKRYLSSGEDEPMGFIWVCQVLDISSGLLKEELVRWGGVDKYIAQWRKSGMTPDGTWITDLPRG